MRSSLGFKDASAKVISRVASAKPKPQKKKKTRSAVRGYAVRKLRIVPEIKKLREDWPRSHERPAAGHHPTWNGGPVSSAGFQRSLFYLRQAGEVEQAEMLTCFKHAAW